MTYRSVRGMHDIFFEEVNKYNKIITVAKNVADTYAFNELITPILEYANVFERNLGEDSDVVSKEIYKFTDRSDEEVALRPEFTAGIIRSFLENSELRMSSMPLRLFSYGPLFRYDRPQKGRYRQFNQVNYEIIGKSSDLEMILIAWEFLKNIDLNKKVKLKLNLLCGEEQRREYEKSLEDFLKDNLSLLTEDSKKRLSNGKVLRILDTKNEDEIKLLSNAPKISDFYSESEKEKLELLFNDLHSLDINIEINSRLVRGLDYYNGVVFEFVDISSDNAQNTVLGGGRYDRMIKEMSQGKLDLPAIGFAAGIERLMDLIDLPQDTAKKIGIITFGSDGELLHAIKAKNIMEKDHEVIILSDKKKIGDKISKAVNMNCEKVLIIGENEVKSNTFVVKDLINSDQKTGLSIEDLMKIL